MTPIGRPGPMTEVERFMFETIGYVVIPGALSPEETAACLEAARRAHAPYPPGEWRQLGHLYESEPAIEALLDHPAVLPKVRALLGDYFIVQSTWCTTQPAGGKSGGYHLHYAHRLCAALADPVGSYGQRPGVYGAHHATAPRAAWRLEAPRRALRRWLPAAAVRGLRRHQR